MRRVFHPASLAALLGFAALALVAATTPASAQSAAIVVEVNEDIITNVDVEQRVLIIAFSAGGRAVDDARGRAVDALIDDALKLQEAARLGIDVTEEEIDATIERIAKNNRITGEQLLGAMGQAGIDPSAFRRQVKAEIAWGKVVRGRYGTRIDPSEGEIEAALGGATSPEDIFDLRQIVVPLAPNAPQPQIAAAMEKIGEAKAQMTSCDDVLAIAPRYSELPANVGKVAAKQLPGPIRSQVASLDIGEITEPIRSNNGVHLIMVCGVERKGAADRDRVAAQLRQEKGGRISASYVADLRRSALIRRTQ